MSPSQVVARSIVQAATRSIDPHISFPLFEPTDVPMPAVPISSALSSAAPASLRDVSEVEPCEVLFDRFDDCVCKIVSRKTELTYTVRTGGDCMSAAVCDYFVSVMADDWFTSAYAIALEGITAEACPRSKLVNFSADLIAPDFENALCNAFKAAIWTELRLSIYKLRYRRSRRGQQVRFWSAPEPGAVASRVVRQPCSEPAV